MRSFSIFILSISATFCLWANEYTIQLLVAKQQESIDAVRKMVEPCKVEWHSYVNSKGYKVLTCGRYSSMEAAKKDIELTRKAVPDAFVSVLRASEKPSLKKKSKSIKVQTVKKAPIVQKPVAVKETPKVQEKQDTKEMPKIKEVPVTKETSKEKEVQEEKPVQKDQESQDGSTVQPLMEQTPLRLINITSEVPAEEQLQEEEAIKTNK